MSIKDGADADAETDADDEAEADADAETEAEAFDSTLAIKCAKLARVRLVFISDTHEQHEAVRVPECDVLVHCGDITGIGDLDALRRFSEWCAKLRDDRRFKEIVAIAGNHDCSLDLACRIGPRDVRDEALAMFSNYGIDYLEDEARTIAGLSFYGSPWTPRFFDWAFSIDDEAQDEEIFSRIPDRLDVLVTHGPPREILDAAYDGRHTGSKALRHAIERVRPRVHAFGHIHEQYGRLEQGGTTFVNASTCTLHYTPTNPPLVLDL